MLPLNEKLRIYFLITIWTVCVLLISETDQRRLRRAQDLLPKDCGRWENFPILPKIAGGFFAGRGQFPSFVYILSAERSSIRGGDTHFCGGTIVARNLIVTAAHCVVNLLTHVRHQTIEVRTGITWRDAVKQVNYTVDKVCNPPKLFILPIFIHNDISTLR